MPKKFQGENTKSAAARARRAEAKAAADAKKQKELEDAYWKDEDKHVMRKEQRKVGARATPGPGRGRRGRAARRHWTWSTAGSETGAEARACAGSRRRPGFGTFRESQALHGLVSLLYVMPGLDKTGSASPLSTQGTPGSSWRRV